MALLTRMQPAHLFKAGLFNVNTEQSISSAVYASKPKVNVLLRNKEVWKENLLCFPLKYNKRKQITIVNASPPTEDAVVASEPLTKEVMVGYLAFGCKAKEKWRVGTELEKFGFELGSLLPIKYEQIAELLNSLSERFDWDKVMEGDYIIGLKQGKQSISLEPGGQFELSGAPLETLHHTCVEVNSYLHQIKAAAEDIGIGFLGIGLQPKWHIEDIPIMPKGQYEIMRKYMPKVGPLGLDTMFKTCSVQVNLDFIRNWT